MKSIFVIFENYGYDGESPLYHDDNSFAIRGWTTRAAAQEYIDTFNEKAKRLHLVRIRGEVREVKIVA